MVELRTIVMGVHGYHDELGDVGPAVTGVKSSYVAYFELLKSLPD